MRDVFAIAALWIDERRRFALATVVDVRDAEPSPVGTTIAVDEDANVRGTIGGAGCNEAEIVEVCLKVVRDGQTRRLDINLASEDEVIGGMACGALMQLAVWRPSPEFANEARAIASGTRAARLRVEYDRGDGVPVAFEHVFEAKSKLVVVGATAVAAELAMLGRRLDFEVVVVDPRPSYATKERIPDASEVVRAWPDDVLPDLLSERTPVVVLSHDPKVDLPALRCALNSDAPYVGLLGSRRSQSSRRATLRDEGFDEATLARVHGPVGLDLGGVTVAETALSILAEIVAVRRGGDGVPLHEGDGTIHRRLERTGEPV
ncbi:MAG TPA: XdhC family protein [Candidatus Cybelea sp.]|jgi:xanthine dehydrogenase accessory factor|nr:XdhC family protein [Candidatus Cybelea sp.]